MLAAVGVDDHRLTAGPSHADRRQHVVGCAAVDAQRDDLRDSGRDRERVGQRLPGPGSRPVDGVAQPRRHAELRQQGEQSLGLVHIGDGFQGEHVRAGAGQNFQPRPVPVGQRRDGQPVAPAILRAVGQCRAVGPDRGRDPETFRAGLVARCLGKLDAAPQQRDGALFAVAANPARREPFEGSLVAGRRGDLRAGAEVRGMHRGDLVRGIRQQPRRPQRVGQVVAARLEFGGQATVADQHGMAIRHQSH